MTLAALPFTSPRLMGELAYGLGAANRGVGGAVNAIAKPLAGRVSPGLLNPDELRLLEQATRYSLPLSGGLLATD